VDSLLNLKRVFSNSFKRVIIYLLLTFANGGRERFFTAASGANTANAAAEMRGLHNCTPYLFLSFWIQSIRSEGDFRKLGIFRLITDICI